MSMGQLWAMLLMQRKVSVAVDGSTLKLRRNCSNCDCARIEVLFKYKAFDINKGRMDSIRQVSYICHFGDIPTIVEMMRRITSAASRISGYPFTKNLAKIEKCLQIVVQMQRCAIRYDEDEHLKANVDYMPDVSTRKGYCDILICYNVRYHGTRCKDHQDSF